MSTRCLVVGGGPAGFSATAWLRDLEVPHAWIDGDGAIGGTLARVGNPIRTLPGQTWDTGIALGQAMSAGLLAAHHPRRARLERLDVTAPDGVIAQIDGEPSRCDTVIVCTGTRPRRLGLDRELETAGVEISVTRNRERYGGRAVAVCGGGDAALEGALLLAPNCPAVYLIHRRSEFAAQPRFVDQLRATSNIRVYAPAQVTELADAGGQLVGITLDNGQRLDVTGLFVRIGVEAAIPAGLEALERSPSGYLVTGDDGRLGRLPVWAAGDVRAQRPQSVATALGDGARAAWAVARHLGFVSA